jgi:hypothetical protein
MANMCEPQGQGAEAFPSELAVNDKRARFDALPSLELSSAEVRNIPRTGGDYVNRPVRWLRSKRVLGSYKNDDTGWGEIIVNKASVKSVTYHEAGPEKTAIFLAVSGIIKDGIYLTTIPKNKNGLLTHVFAGKAAIDGTPYAISYAIREDNNGRRYYDHNLTKIEALDQIESPSGELRRTRAQTTPDGVTSTGEESLSNILKKHLKVNSDVKNVSTTHKTP